LAEERNLSPNIVAHSPESMHGTVDSDSNENCNLAPKEVEMNTTPTQNQDQHQENQAENPQISQAVDFQSHHDLSIMQIDTFENESQCSRQSDTEIVIAPAKNFVDFKAFLTNWALVNVTPRTHVTSLLKGIKEHIETPYGINLGIPCDYRSLLKTPRESDTILPAGTFGEFAYISLKDGISRVIRDGYTPEPGQALKLRTFVDAFCPQHKRTLKFWAVLHSIFDDELNRVFMSGLYCGTQNPSPFNDILADFVREFNELKEEFKIDNFDHPLRLQSGGPYIQDIPAKADVKSIKPSGFFSCDKCTSKGKWDRGTYFPDLTFTLRTNEHFRLRLNPLHHHPERSILEEINDVDMVADFTCDYLHFVLHGATKKYLKLYFVSPSKVRLSKHIRDQAYSIFESIAVSITAEFQWKPRELEKFETFKAKEFRYFLLYAGIVVMKELLPSNEYASFLNLSLAIRILCSQELVKEEMWLGRADKMLFQFVKFIKWIGERNVVRVVHGLLHLVADCRRYGSLDNFSAFYFESYQGRLGRLINGPAMKLQQIVKRYKEEDAVGLSRKETSRKKNEVVLGKKHNNGPLVNASVEEQYNSVEFHGYLVSCKAPNNTIMRTNATVVKVQNIFKRDNVLYFVGKTYINHYDYFTRPRPSSSFNIIASDGNLGPLIEFPITECFKKCICFERNDHKVFIPLLH